MALPENSTTIEEFIEAGRGETVSYIGFSFMDMVSNGTWVSVHNVINDYMDELLENSLNVRLGYEEQQKYFYKPKLLCHDLYGNPELYFIILLMNDMADVKEFNKPTIKLIRKADMGNFVSTIYNAEQQALLNYNSK